MLETKEIRVLRISPDNTLTTDRSVEPDFNRAKCELIEPNERLKNINIRSILDSFGRAGPLEA
jgi:hypothetical protein